MNIRMSLFSHLICNDSYVMKLKKTQDSTIVKHIYITKIDPLQTFTFFFYKYVVCSCFLLVSPEVEEVFNIIIIHEHYLTNFVLP